jgi:hypothetical protein
MQFDRQRKQRQGASVAKNGRLSVT